MERDGKVYSGVPDDRYFLTSGGGGSFSAGLSQNIVNSFAGTAYMAVAYPATQEYAQHLFNVCIDRWKASNWSSNWDTVVQFALASDAFEKAGVAYDDQDTLSAAYFKGLLDGLVDANMDVSRHINLLALKDLMDDDFWARVEASVEAQNVTVNNQPYGVNFTSGASWGASPNTYSGVRNISFMYYHFPEKKFEQNILRSVDYLMGRHPATNKSWISGVGTQSAMHPYNSNRAEESYIPGSILPGHITFSDYVESMDDFSYLWFEGESIINYQSSWLPVGIAAGHIAHNEPEPEVAATKDFESSFDAELVTKTGSGMFGGSSSNYYFSDDGFNMIMYATDFDRTFGDQHCAGIEMIQDGRRIATNGDIHLLPTPEQWDATPAPTKGTITADGNTVTVPMTIPAETFEGGAENPAVNYQLIAEPEPGGIKLTVKLDEPLPEDLVGKAGFNMEFLPAVFIGKSYQSDSDGDGAYDQFGVFPQDPRDEMVDMERARTNNQAWYVQEWNEQRGDAQPVPFATGNKMTFAAETDDYRIRISSDDGLALYDGRNRAQNGWFVLRTLIPADKTEIVEKDKKTEPAEESESRLRKALKDEGVDVNVGISFTGDDENMYMSLLAAYAAEEGEKAANIKECYRTRDWKNYGVYVHSLKSTSKMIGAAALAEIAAESEAASNTEDTLVIDNNHDKMMEMYASLAAVIREHIGSDTVSVSKNDDEILEFMPE